MDYLVDTNISLRALNPNDPQHLVVAGAVQRLAASGGVLHYTQQTRREFWNVCTRPVSANGLGFQVADAVSALSALDLILHRLPEHATADLEWDRLVVQYEVIGRAVHDAQLVASMLANGITHLPTLNTQDFARYAGEITVLHPSQV